MKRKREKGELAIKGSWSSPTDNERPCSTPDSVVSHIRPLLVEESGHVRNDVIRYRYGDEQHLEEALKRIFQYGLVGSATSFYATCNFWMVTEDGKYCLVLVFEAKALQLSDFEKRQAKFASFFGPGITAEVGEF
uniref:Uncharacterized protein n=1 Tax=Vitis vinifera TaxID=29760 RepID=F6I405_VITVI